MITITVPTKFLKVDGQQSNQDYLQTKILVIVNDWKKKYPKLSEQIVYVHWGDYYDVKGKAIKDGSREWSDLYKVIKSFIWTFR